MRRAPMLATALAIFSLHAASAQERSPVVNYVLHCSGCHGLNGLGTETGGVPAFPDSVGTIGADPEGRLYLMHVPGVISAGLSDAEIAAVMNHVLSRWGDARAEPFGVDEVAGLRAAPVDDVVALRRRLAERLAAQGRAVAPYPWP